MKKLNLSTLLVGISFLSIASCGGGGGGSSSNSNTGTAPSNTYTVLQDIPVVNADVSIYCSGSSYTTTITNSNGQFIFAYPSNNSCSATISNGSLTYISILSNTNQTINEYTSIFSSYFLSNPAVFNPSITNSNNLSNILSSLYFSQSNINAMLNLANSYSYCLNNPSISNCSITLAFVNQWQQNPYQNSYTINGISMTNPIFNPYIVATIYQGQDYLNEPTITIYINNQPVTLLLDTGASGVVVNQSAINIPSSSYLSYTFSTTYGDGSTISGTAAMANVCINPSITSSCVVMPIGVITGGNAFADTTIQGDFGVDNSLNFQSTTYSYNYYLLKQNPYYDGFWLSWSSLSNGYYQSSTTIFPIGTITIGNTNDITPKYSFSYGGNFPETLINFGSFTDYGFYDTGSNFNYLSTSVLNTEIPNFSTSSDEGNCSSSDWVSGGFSLYYSISNFSYTFITQPSYSSICNILNNYSVIQNIVIDAKAEAFGNEDFGLPEMLNHTFIWYLDTNPNDYDYGLVYQLGIK